MRFLLVNSDYPEFLHWLYDRAPGLRRASYDNQMRDRNESLFGVADFYSSNLRKLGHEAFDVHVNNEWMQRAWAEEHGISVTETPAAQEGRRDWFRRLRRRGARITPETMKPALRRILARISQPPAWMFEILAAQVRHYRPDILLNQEMDIVNSRVLTQLRPHVRLIVGQIASPMPRDGDFRSYDLIISSLPHFVERFRARGIRAEFQQLAFEPAVLRKLDKGDESIPVSFVGTLSPHHNSRVRLLEYLCRHLDLRVWGHLVDGFPVKSPIRNRYEGPAWGREMLQILLDSRITLNQHIGLAESFANNMRMYEATGVGTMLITDWKENLPDLFELEKEVVTYKSGEECLARIRYYLEHEGERRAIARAGQERTLREHTYLQRMQEFVWIVAKYLR